MAHRSMSTTTLNPRFLVRYVQTEIDRLSAKFGERAREFRLPQRDGLPNAIIAIWGKIQLKQLDANEVATVAAGGGHEGILVSFLGDLQHSAKTGVPVYQLTGGAGFLWAAAFRNDGKGVLRFLTVDASKIEPSTQIAQNKPSQIAPQSCSRRMLDCRPSSHSRANPLPRKCRRIRIHRTVRRTSQMLTLPHSRTRSKAKKRL